MIPERFSTIESEQFSAWLVRHEVGYSADFVPFSKSRNAYPNAKTSELSINWRVTLTCAGRTFTCDYSQGIGHLPLPWKGASLAYLSVDHAAFIRTAVECGACMSAGLVVNLSCGKLAPPAVSDVLHSLALDASALDMSGFNEWAREYGYDTDSRSAEAIYRTCLDQTLKLRATIGARALDALCNIREE